MGTKPILNKRRIAVLRAVITTVPRTKIVSICREYDIPVEDESDLKGVRSSLVGYLKDLAAEIDPPEAPVVEEVVEDHEAEGELSPQDPELSPSPNEDTEDLGVPLQDVIQPGSGTRLVKRMVLVKAEDDDTDPPGAKPSLMKKKRLPKVVKRDA